MTRLRTHALNTPEALEGRALPSAGVSAFLTSTGILRITGTPAADEIIVRQQDGTVWIDGTDIFYAGAAYEAVEAESVRRIDISGRAGDDVIFLGGEGQEVQPPARIDAGAGHDWVYGGLGNDTILGGGGHDTIFGSGGADWLYGQGGSDFLDDGDRTVSEVVVGGYGWDWNADVVARNGTSLTDVRQQALPTCSFLASLSALAGQGYDFQERISYDGPNAAGVPVYSVAFWDGTDWAWQSIEFDGWLTEADPQPAAEGESWVALMSRAWVAFHGGDGTAYPHEALLALTGTEPTHADYWDSMMTDADLDDIVQTLAEGGVIIAATGPDEYLATNVLLDNHAYAVLRVFQYGGDNWLEIRNPMGVDGGLFQTGNRWDGFVYVTWEEFQQSMVYLAAA